MKFKTNLAYNKNRSNRLRQHEAFEKIHVGRVESTKKFFHTKLYIFLIAITSIFLSAFIFNLVKANEITQRINKIKEQLKIQASEHIRLKTELEQKVNLKKIEDYAKSKGMKKLDNSQINYIYSPSNSTIEIPKEQTNEQTFFKKIQSVISSIFNKIQKYFS